MAVRDINDLYQQLSADENFSGLFNSPEEFAETMQSMSSDRQQAFYDKLVSGTQISNVDFTNALKKKEEEGFTFEFLSAGSKPKEGIEKLDIKVPEPGIEEPAPQITQEVAEDIPIDPRQKVKNRLIGIFNELGTNPTGNWAVQYQELLKDPEFKKYQFSGDIQKELSYITSEWSRLSKENPQLKDLGEQIGLAPKQVGPITPPAPKTAVLSGPQSIYGRAYADAVAAERRKKDPLGQSTQPLYVPPSKRDLVFKSTAPSQGDASQIVAIEPEKLIEGEKFTEAEIKKVKTTPGTLYNVIGSKKLKYYTSQGQEFPVDEFALGSMLFNHSSLEIQDANGPVDITNLNATGGRKEGMSVMNEESFRKVLLNDGFPEYKIDDEIERLKDNYLKSQAASEMDQAKNRYLSESGGNQSIANVKFLGDYSEKGRELLTDDEQEAYALVLRLEGMYKTLRANTNLSSQEYVNGVKVSDFIKTIQSTQEKLTALRDNPNNLYDWETGEFVDTRIATNKPKVAKIQAQNEEFQIQYANTPKGDLTRMRNTLLAQRDVIVRKMSEDGIPVPEAGTFGSFVAKLQTSAARAAGNYTITLPNGLTMNSVQYEKKVKEYQQQLFGVEKNLYGINRSLMLNENVLLRDEAAGFIESTLSNIGTAVKSVGREFIPGAGEADAKADWEVRNSLLMLNENGYVISPELKSLARKTVGEQIFDSAGMLVDAMGQIAIGNIAIPEMMAMKWAKSFSAGMKTRYGRAGEMVFENTAGAIRQGAIFQMAGQGFATGVGESLGQLAYDAMKLERLFVNKGRILPFLTRSILGGAGETIQEYAGQYLDVVAENGIDARDNFKKTFGHDIESALDQLLVIGITSVGFSGAANLKILTATASTLENILENPQTAAAYGDILDAEKKQEIEEVLKIVNSKINDRQSQKIDKGIVDEKTGGVDSPMDATTRAEEISALEEKRKEELQNLYDANTPTTDSEKAQLNEQVDEINKKYNDELDTLIPKSTQFESLTGRNLSAVVAGADLNTPHVIEFLASIPQERNRKAAANLIAVAQKANATLRSILPDAAIILHDKKSFADKMEQRGLPANRKGNFTIDKGIEGTPRVEIQINVEDGNFEDIAHEVTHAVLFNKFYDNDARLQEISDLKNTISATPQELNDGIAAINKKYDEKFSETLGAFRDGLKKIATEAQSAYLDKFVEQYSPDQTSEEWVTEFTAILTANGERIMQEDPTLFERLLALINKIVDKIGSQAGLKLQKFTDAQEMIDFMNNLSSSIRQGKSVEDINLKTKANAVQKQKAGQVSVQPEARVGEEVEQGKPQAEPQEVTDKGRKEVATNIQTGVSVTIEYNKNPEKAPSMGKTFGQDIEPAGNYITQNEGFTPQGWKSGRVTLNSPLVIDITPETQISYKRDLSKKFGNKKGAELSNEIVKQGYDSIVTKYADGSTGEIVLLANQIETKPQELTDKGRKAQVGQVENLPVYFGGPSDILNNLRPESVLYVTQDKAEAKRYADQVPSSDKADVVNELAITGNIATEDEARAIMEDLDLNPEAEGYNRDELMLMELLDPNFEESALSASDIKKFNDALIAKGFDAVEFVDNGLRNKEAKNIYVVNTQSLSVPKKQPKKQKINLFTDENGNPRDINNLAKSEEERLPLIAESEGIGRLGKEAANIARRFSEGKSENDVDTKLESGKLKKWAKKNNLYVEDYRDIFNFELTEYEPGSESTVFAGVESKYVYKVTNGGPWAPTWTEFFNRIAAHNLLFPDTRYEVVGFTESDIDFGVILKQPLINYLDGVSNPEELDNEMLKLGYTKGKKYGQWINEEDGVILDDLHQGNVVYGPSGAIQFIDPIIDFMPNSKLLKEITDDFDGTNAETRASEQKDAIEGLTERTPLNLKPEEEKAVYDIVDDFKGKLYEQENLDIQGSFSQPFAPSGRMIDKARIDYTQDFVVDGIQMRAVKYINPLTSRNKKYNATMSDHTKVGSYENPRTGIVVNNLFGGFLFSYIAENYDNGVVWASTTAAKARELIMNSRYQDKTVIYRMNRASGSNGNDNFAEIAMKELFAPMERGLVSEEEMLAVLNDRMSNVKLGTIVMSQGYATGPVIRTGTIVKTDKKTKEKTEVEIELREFASITEFKQAFLGGGIKEKLPFATRGPLWNNLLIADADTSPNSDYYKKLEEWGIPRVPEIVDLIAEPVTDTAEDSDIIAALKIDKPEMVEIMENGKKVKVAKVWTTFRELVNEEEGIYYTPGVRHTSYPYVVKGSPLGAYTEFHSVKDYFPIINEWLTRTKESEGYLNKQEYLAKNADAIRTAQFQMEEAKVAYEAIAKSKDVPKETKELLKNQLKEFEKVYKEETRFTPRLTSPYKAIETMHGELMRNFNSTGALVATGRGPLMEDKGRIEPWSTPQQEITSAGTSINKAKLPGVYSDKAFFNILRNIPGDKITIVDVGSGKYANMNIKPLLERGVVSDLITEGSQIKLKETAVPTIEEIIASKEIVYLPYDPFNQPASVNESTVEQVRGGRANIGISPNVLNVIAEAEAREGVIANLADAVGDTGTAIIQIYEGDPKDKGNGKITKTGGEQSWQNNQPTSWYIPEVKKYFANVKFANKIIIADNKVFEDKGRVTGKALEAKEYGVPQRYKGDVGKFIGGDLYVHKSAMDVLPIKELELAESKLPEDFEYEIVKYNASKGSFSFIGSPDWNTANEPIVGDSYKVSSSGEVTITRQKADPQIYHHKWNFVRDNYDGFDVRQSIQRSIDWYRDAKEEVNMFKIGTKSYWNANAEPLINNTILSLQDKARLQDDIQDAYAKYKRKNPLALPTDLGSHLLNKGFSLGEIKRFIPELEAFYKKEAVKRFKSSITKTQGKLKKRQDLIREQMAANSDLSYTTLYEKLKMQFEDFELYKAFYEEGAQPSELDEIFGTDYRQTIQSIISETQDGKTVYSPDLLREIRNSARARKMVDIADQMKNVFGELGDVVSAQTIINAAADSLEEGFIEAAMQEVTDDMRRRRQEMKESADTLVKISKGEIEAETIIDVSKLLSFAGRILQTGRGLTDTQEGLEKLIFNSLEIVEYRPGRNVIRKQRVFKLLPEQKTKIRKAIAEFRKSKAAFNEATKALEDGPNMYTDQAFDTFDKAKAQFEKDARLLKMTISAFKKVGFGNWFTSMTALGLLSFRTLTIGIVGNVEMYLASAPKKTVLGKIFGWGRILADKLVKNLSQVGGKDINEQIARGTGVNVDTSIYRKMAFEQGKQQIINIFQNTVADAGTDNNAFIDNQAIIDSNQELKKSFKMFGKLLTNLLPKDKEATKKEWAIAFDKLLLLMNEKDEEGNPKLEQQNPRGYQMASTFLRGIFGSIPTATGKAIALSGDRVFFKFGYYQSLVAYANSQGITDPREVQRFIRLNSVPGTNGDAMARRAGDYRIFQSDNALVKGMANYRKNITEAEENLNAQIAVLKSQKKGLSRFFRVYPAKMKRLGYKVAAVLVSPFTRIPSNFISIGVQKTVFPISFAVYMSKQFELREKVRRYEDLFGLDKNPKMTKTKVREMEAMRMEIFELQTQTQRALSNTLQAVQLLAFGALLLMSGAASAPYGDDEDEKARARAAGIAQQPSGTINFTHFFEWASGQANRYRVNKKDDIIMSYTNLGIIGFGLSEFMSLFSGIAAKEYEGKKVMGLGEDGYSNASWDLVFESLSNGVTNLSFIQNIVALGNAVKGQGNAVENLAVNLTKTLLTVPTMSFGVFGAIERAEGITVDPMRNYMPELETAENSELNRFQARLITSLTGKSPITWFGLKDEMGEFKSPYASPYYRAQIGPHGEELYKKNTFWDVRGGDWLGAYIQASFDPFSFHDYEGFVSTVKKFEVGQQYRKGDIIQGPNGIYAVMKDNKGLDLKNANKNPNDPEFQFIESTEKFFDKDRFMANQRGTEYSQALFDMMNVYQQVTGDNKPFKVMSRLYDPYITAKDAQGEFNIYIPEKYFRELAIARGEAARNAYGLEGMKATLERIYRAEDEDVFETDEEYKAFVKQAVEDVLLGPADTEYNRDGGVGGLMNKAIEALENSDRYRKIKRLALVDGLKSEIFTEEEYLRMVRSEDLSAYISGIPKEELKFRK
jgi:hypothetical protein